MTKTQTKKLDFEMAGRLLSNISLNAERGGWTSLDNEKVNKALLYFKIEDRMSEGLVERRKYVYYGKASTYAQMRNANEAVKNLKLAFESGFDDIEDLTQNKFFNPIRQHSKFKTLLENYLKLEQ